MMQLAGRRRDRTLDEGIARAAHEETMAALAEERAASEKRHAEAMAESERKHEETMRKHDEAMVALTELIKRTGSRNYP